MGAFLTSDKNGYYWILLSYLADENIYVTDTTLLPNTPSKLQTYVDFYPELYNPVLPQKLTFEINEVPVAYAIITSPSGMVYVDIGVPLGRFTLVTKNAAGDVLRTESYNAKNYAMFLGVMAQSYNERRTDIEANMADQKFQEMRSGRVYNILGAYFDFPPPPGWDVAKYRAAVLGGCGPGFISSFFHGTTKEGVTGTIKSITCEDPTVGPAQGGVRWVVRNQANSNPTDPGAKGFFVTSQANIGHAFTPPHYRAILASELWWANAVDVTVNGSTMVVPDEQIVKLTNSYIEAPISGPFDLAGLTLQFSIEEVGDPSTKLTYNTSFPLPTTDAFMAAADIVAQNPTLTDAVHGSIDGLLRIGVYPVAGKTFRITITAGTALPVLGWKVGDSADVAPDQLANPWLTTPVGLTVGAVTFTDGVDFVSIPATGEIVWLASTSINIGVPPAGTVMDAAYTYQMRREIIKEVELVKHINDVIRYQWA
jgi:hypothetical protein